MTEVICIIRNIVIIILPSRKPVLLISTQAECNTSNRSALVNIMSYTHCAILSDPMITIIKVVVGDSERVEEATQPLVSFLGVLFINGYVVPELAVIATDIESNLISGFAVAKDLIINVADSYTMVSLCNGGKVISGILIRVINEFVHVVFPFCD
jgi:hypothetical protein